MSRAKVMLIRGDVLNPFEVDAWTTLSQVEVVAIGATTPKYALDDLPFPTVLLKTRGTSLPYRVAARFDRVRRRLGTAGELVGLEEVLVGASLMHAAETFMPWSAQAAMVASTSGKPLVLTCWETIPFLHDESAEIRARKDLVKTHTSLFLAATRRARDALEIEGVDGNRIRVVNPGLLTQNYKAERSPGASVRILLPGRLIKEKGGVEALRALAALPRKILPTVRISFVGRGDAEPRLRAVAGALGIADIVEFLGGLSHSNMRRLYAQTDIVLVPSLTTPYWEEQFGMVLIEAMASGCAVLATASGAIPEVVGDAALVVPPYDIPALAQALTSLIQNEESRNDLAKRARKRAESEFDASVTGLALAAAYAEVL